MIPSPTRLVPGVIPVPDSATASGLPGALLVTVRVPLAAPLLVGANLTLTVQELPTPMELPQDFVWLNVPLVVMDVTEAAVLPGLVTVTVCAALAELAATSPNRMRRQSASASPVRPLWR